MSASQAWAVGATGSSPDPFIARWNGTAWAQVAAPTPGFRWPTQRRRRYIGYQRLGHRRGRHRLFADPALEEVEHGRHPDVSGSDFLFGIVAASRDQRVGRG